MAFTINPPNSPLVNSSGHVTPEWYRFFSIVQRLIGGDIIERLQKGPYITYEPSETLQNAKVASGRNGIDVSVIDSGAIFSLTETGVVAGSYGNERQLLTIEVDEFGRISLVATSELNSDNVTEGTVNLFFTDERARAALSGIDGIDYDQTTGEIALADTAVTPGSYGSATEIPLLDIDQQGRVVAAATAEIPMLDSGTYTPTLTNVANTDARTAFPCQYMRVGSVVTVSGKLNVDPSAATTLTQVGISLPITSNFGAEQDCAGTASATALTETGAITADASNDMATLSFVSAVASNHTITFQFTYRVL